MSTLTEEEKDVLLDLIILIYGNSVDYSRQRDQFNEHTIAKVEDALIRLANCNDWMKELLTDLAGGGRLAARGWLKKALKTTHKALTKDKSRWNGAGCRNFVRAFQRSEIESTFSDY